MRPRVSHSPASKIWLVKPVDSHRNAAHL